MRPKVRKVLFETLYKNRYLYQFASTVPFAGQWRIWQRLILPRLHGKDVLELGCGLGDLLADMIEAGYTCRAVERSPQMVAAARAKLKERGIGQGTWIIQGNAQSLPFSDAIFDNVISTFPSDYIYDPDTLSEVARVLRPTGKLIVIEGANLLPAGMLQPLLLLIHLFVYGPRVFFRDSSANQSPTKNHFLHIDDETNAGTTTIEVTDAHFGTHIPLEQAGLRRRSQLVRSRRWEVAMTIGEKVAI
jgi:ubiquinone/menaquinone biosynthesis C-methylase UbiE